MKRRRDDDARLVVGSVVCSAAMPNTYDVYLSIIVADFIKNAPVPNAYPPPIVGAGKFEAARRTWVLQGIAGL
jgi:hypothetical protein